MSTPDPRTEAADKITTEILEEMSAKGDTLWYRREELEGIIRDALTTEAARVRRMFFSGPVRALGLRPA